MSDPRETLARIRKRADAATEGPWEVKPYDGWHKESDNEISSFVGPDATIIVEQLGCGCCDVGLEVTPADAAFIAAARTTVPALVAALEAVLKVHRDGGESQGYLDNGHYGVIDHCCTECGSFGEYGTTWPCPTVKAITDALDTNH